MEQGAPGVEIVTYEVWLNNGAVQVVTGTRALRIDKGRLIILDYRGDPAAIFNSWIGVVKIQKQEAE